MSQAVTYLEPNEKLLVIIGPSAAGKTTIVDQLVRERILELTPSWTTRRERNGQEAVSDHVFVDEVTFAKRQTAGFFLETVQLFGQPYHYGLPRVTHNRHSAIPVVVLRAMVLPLLGKHYQNVVIYQIEAAESVVRQRLKWRGDSVEDNQKRLRLYENELAAGRDIAHRTFTNNDELGETYKLIITALHSDFT